MSRSSSSPTPNLITPRWFQDHCRASGGASTCRFVTGGPQGMECAKHTSLRGYLDQRADVGAMRAVGDNCPGITRDGIVAWDGVKSGIAPD